MFFLTHFNFSTGHNGRKSTSTIASHRGGPEVIEGFDSEAGWEEDEEAAARFEQPFEVGVQRLGGRARAMEIFHMRGIH